ncbi:hypothetical protein OIU78_008483 [Salix suchowensis]|nr:hypothetical protein OIU78_008483 [Salix suchowensis]
MKVEEILERAKTSRHSTLTKGRIHWTGVHTFAQFWDSGTMFLIDLAGPEYDCFIQVKGLDARGKIYFSVAEDDLGLGWVGLTPPLFGRVMEEKLDVEMKAGAGERIFVLDTCYSSPLVFSVKITSTAALFFRLHTSFCG